MNNTANIINDSHYHRSSTYSAFPILHYVSHGILLQQQTKDECIPLAVRVGVANCSDLTEKSEIAVQILQYQRTFNDLIKCRGT